MTKNQREEIEAELKSYMNENDFMSGLKVSGREGQIYTNHIIIGWLKDTFKYSASHVYKTKAVLDREVLDEVIQRLEQTVIQQPVSLTESHAQIALTKLKQARKDEL